MASHFINGSWIGYLINEHYKEDGEQSSYFGLSYTHCDQLSLKTYQTTRPDRFKIIKETQHLRDCLSKLAANSTTILVFETEHLDEGHNYMAFDQSFRTRFHQQRALRKTLSRKKDEFWVTVHFRWGDVKTHDPSSPDTRAGLRLKEYCLCIDRILILRPNARIFLFAEELNNITEACKIIDHKGISFQNESISWKRDIDIISQSNLLIGGSSSFFVLGAHLCQSCTVIHNSVTKFSKSKYEKTLRTHMVDSFCNIDINCYLRQIIKYLRVN